jgi:hypothetical protein
MPFTRAAVLDRENIRVLPDAKKRLISFDAQRRRVERLVRMLHCLFIVSESAYRYALLGRFGDDVKRPRGGLRAESLEPFDSLPGMMVVSHGFHRFHALPWNK